MTIASSQISPPQDKAAWKKIVAAYQVPDLRRSLWQIANSLIPYIILWIIMIQTMKISYWLTLPFIVLAAGFLARLFIIFHDCGHGSFFASRRANDSVGFIMGLFNFTPYYFWRHEHAVHHASSGDLDRRGSGDVWMMSVNEYQAATVWKRLIYRLYRNPIILFGIGPIFLFLILHRLPVKKVRRREQFSILYTNLALVLLAAVISLLIGFQTFAILQLSVLFVSSTVGVWLFYVQHQYEGVYWQRHDEWDYATAALEGSSFYKLPKVLQWFTGNIGFHHIHHLSPRIPNYNLERCHNENPLFQIEPVTLRQSLGSLRYRFWDEANNRLIGYRELRQIEAAAASVAPILVPSKQAESL
jgi:omega-6 fatty acid desaturase (delta-12 desaturase)